MVTTTRWRKYGKDRLYVTADDEMRIGWRDLITGEDHLEQTALAAEYAAAVSEWIAANSESELPPPTTPVLVASEEVEPAQEPSEQPGEWTDLAGRRAGTMAREQAILERQAAPVRTTLARVLRVHTDERAWRIGADGEEMVGARLEKLVKKEPRWRFLNAIPVWDGDSDIDHLVIGPGGVFSLNAKHHPGAKIWVAGDTFIVNGQRNQYVRTSRREAAMVSACLKAATGLDAQAVGVIVPVRADDITIKTPPNGVHIVSRVSLVTWLRKQPALLDNDTISTLFEAARRSTTWTKKL